jgi:hypothetical protein
MSHPWKEIPPAEIYGYIVLGHVKFEVPGTLMLNKYLSEIQNSTSSCNR